MEARVFLNLGSIVRDAFQGSLGCEHSRFVPRRQTRQASILRDRPLWTVFV